MSVKRKRRVIKKKGLTLYQAANVVKSGQTWKDLAEATQLAESYREAIGKQVSAISLMDDLIELGQRFILNEKVYKIASGLVFSALADTVDQKSFSALCRDKFDITAQTALRYKSIYDAWFSGTFLYNIPKGDDGRPQNPLDLSVRDLELGASLIVEGEFDKDSAGILFGKGSWLDKKDVLREQKPKIVKRDTAVDRKGGKLTSEEVEKKVLIKVHSAGEVYYQGKRIGFLDITASDTQLRSVALRAVEVLKGEFNNV